MTPASALVRVLLSAGAVVAVDQATKALAVRCAGRQPAGPPPRGRCGATPAAPRATLHRSARASPGGGCARGSLAIPLGPAALVLAWGAAAATLLAGVAVAGLFASAPAQVAVGALLGGAGSNLGDRLRRGAVVDFIDAGIWPAFNLADVAIVLGGLLALWQIS